MARTKQTARRPKELRVDHDEVVEESACSRKRGREVLPDLDVGLDDLEAALTSQGAAFSFCVNGEGNNVFPLLPGLVVKGKRFSLPLTEDTGPMLAALCQVAPYGKGDQTLVDPVVRDALQVDAADFSFENSAADSAMERLSSLCVKGLGVVRPCAVVPYKLLLYGPGMHFAAPHRDSEKQDGMFATLIVELPSLCSGGQLTVHHKEATIRCFGDRATRPYSCSYAAFYADCLHELSPITSGYRLAIAYNVISLDKKHVPSLSAASNRVSAIVDLFSNALETHPYLLVPTEYSYTQKGKRVLKGMDHNVVEWLSRPGFKIYLADLIHERESTGDGWDYGSLDWHVEGESTKLTDFTCIYPEDGLDNLAINADEEELWQHAVMDLPDWSAEDPDEKEEDGYLGNEGMSKTETYKRRCLVILGAHSHFRLLPESSQVTMALRAEPGSWERGQARNILLHARGPLGPDYISLASKILPPSQFASCLAPHSVHAVLGPIEQALAMYRSDQKQDLFAAFANHFFPTCNQGFYLLQFFSAQERASVLQSVVKCVVTTSEKAFSDSNINQYWRRDFAPLKMLADCRSELSRLSLESPPEMAEAFTKMLSALCQKDQHFKWSEKVHAFELIHQMGFPDHHLCEVVASVVGRSYDAPLRLEPSLCSGAKKVIGAAMEAKRVADLKNAEQSLVTMEQELAGLAPMSPPSAGLGGQYSLQVREVYSTGKSVRIRSGFKGVLLLSHLIAPSLMMRLPGARSAKMDLTIHPESRHFALRDD